MTRINPSNAELNPIYHLLALLGTHHILHVSRIRVNMCVDCNSWQIEIAVGTDQRCTLHKIMTLKLRQINPSGPSLVLGSTQPLIEMSNIVSNGERR